MIGKWNSIRLFEQYIYWTLHKKVAFDTCWLSDCWVILSRYISQLIFCLSNAHKHTKIELFSLIYFFVLLNTSQEHYLLSQCACICVCVKSKSDMLTRGGNWIYFSITSITSIGTPICLTAAEYTRDQN